MPPRKGRAAAPAARKASRIASPVSMPASLPPAASASRANAGPSRVVAGAPDSDLSSPAGSPASSASTEPLADVPPAGGRRSPARASPTKKRRIAPAPVADGPDDDDGDAAGGASTSDEGSGPAMALTKSYGGLVAKPSPTRPRARSGRTPSDSSLSSAGASDDDRQAVRAPQASTSAARPSLLPPQPVPLGDEGSELSALSDEDDDAGRIIEPVKSAPATYGRASEVARGKRRRVSTSPLPEPPSHTSPALTNGALAPPPQQRRPSLEELSAIATEAAEDEAVADEAPAVEEEAMEVDAPPELLKVPAIEFDDALEAADEPEDEVGDGDDDYTEAEAHARVHGALAA